MVVSARNMYLIDGRRVTIADLVDAALLNAGDVLVFDRPRVGAVHRATVTDEGDIRLEDGRVFRSPSPAAVTAADLSAIDGWHAWRTDTSGRSLDSLRAEMLDQIAAQSQGPAGGEAEGSSQPPRRHARLKEARAAAEKGEPVEISVRDLIALWDVKNRGHRVEQRIEADLNNHDLITSPDFRKVTLDTTVSLFAMTKPDVDGARLTVVTTNDDDGFETSLTVGNLPSAMNGVVGIPQDSTFEQAITKMMINDFSQLAVMSGQHTLRGAVTWKSITQASHANQNPVFADTIVHAKEVRYDQDLVDVLFDIETADFVFVRDDKNRVSGIVTAADVVHAYGELASPFFLMGALDRALRHIISRSIPWEDVVNLCDTDGSRGLSSVDDLTMGDYHRVLANTVCWSKVGWPIDRAIFTKRLDELRHLRNDIMHFNPDPLPGDAITKIRSFIGVLRSYGG